MTLTIIFVALHPMPPPSTIGRTSRNSALWAAIFSLHTTTLSIPIPKLLEILPTFMVLYLEIFSVPTTTTRRRTAQNGAKWIAILSIHPMLFAISALHSLLKINIVQAYSFLLCNLIKSTLEKALLQSFQNKTELMINLENKNQPSTPWMNQSAQSD